MAYAPSYQSIDNEAIASRSSFANLRDNVSQLTKTVNEIKGIAQYFDGTFEGSAMATETNFKRELKDYGLLHLAMHGKADFENPDKAHLVFSNVNQDTLNDGLLYHHEIANLKTNAQLVVLSACETGIGQAIEGEGVMSLGRGFMYIGVPSVVMSLWKMNDLSTSELMPLFYKNLSDGLPKDKALCQAKLSYLNNTSSRHARPFYWAGLISLGNNEPIKKAFFNENQW